MNSPKRPRNIQTAINNILKQRNKAVEKRDEATSQIESFDASLKALGWSEDEITEEDGDEEFEE